MSEQPYIHAKNETPAGVSTVPRAVSNSGNVCKILADSNRKSNVQMIEFGIYMQIRKQGIAENPARVSLLAWIYD